MSSIFNPADNDQLIARLKNLSPGSQPLWGTMDVSQMLSHANEPLLVLKGDKVLKFTFLGMLFGGYLKKKYLKERSFGKNLPTHVQFKVTDKKQFESELEKLIKTMLLIKEKGTAIITKHKHPFFGKMTADEWGNMMYIHTDHHLKQFGV